MDLFDRDRLPLREYKLVFTASNLTIRKSRCFPFQTENGRWMAMLDIAGSFSPQATPPFTLTFQGLVFSGAGDGAYGASITCQQATDSAQYTIYCWIAPSTNTIGIRFSGNCGAFYLNGIVELASKPTFME